MSIKSRGLSAERHVARQAELRHLRAEKTRTETAMRAAYLKLFVGEVRVPDNLIEIAGPTAALEAGVATGMPVKAEVPSFDREWCRLQDSNL